MEVVEDVKVEENAPVIQNETETLPSDATLNSTSTITLKRKVDSADDKGSETGVPAAVKPKKSSRKSLQSQFRSPAWFSTESVHFLEIRSLPEFFSRKEDGAAVGEDYIKSRNFMVGLYSSNPFVYLSATECRKRIAGDACAIIKIHNFLDVSGVINFNVKSDCRPTLTPSHLSTVPGVMDRSSSSPPLPLHTPGSLSVKEAPKYSDNTTAVGYKRTQFEETKEWSAMDDRKLINAVAESVGNWAAVAEMFRDGSDICLSPLQCLARFISLPAVAPASDAVAGTALYTALLSTEMAAEMAAALGCDAAQEIVERVISSSEDVTQDQKLAKTEFALSKTEMAIAVAIAAASISALAKSDSDKERRRLKSLLADYVQHRMAALEEKMKLLVEVDRMIDLEKERLEVDRRDAQIQRAQLAFKLSGAQGT